MSAANDPTPTPVFPAATATVLLRGPAGLLELACAVPQPQVARAGVALICHPHPLHGGSMTNKVVTTLERTLAELGFATIRFNFRGVGQSEGAHDDGIGETDDVRTIAAWARLQRPGDVVWLAGFSFGSYVALRAAESVAPDQLILVAPPVGRWDFSGIAAPACRWLIVQGEADEVVDAEAVFGWAAGLEPPVTVARLVNTSHFFHGRLLGLRDAVKDAVSAHLPPPRSDA